MRILLILLAYYLVSCGTGEILDSDTSKGFALEHKFYQAGRKAGMHHVFMHDNDIDARVKDMIEEFESYLGEKVSHVGVRITDHTISKCRNYGLLGYKRITYPADYLKLPKGYQKIRLFHELGHCVLNQFHNDCSVLNIMCSELNNEEMDSLLEDWDNTIDLLFNGI